MNKIVYIDQEYHYDTNISNNVIEIIRGNISSDKYLEYFRNWIFERFDISPKYVYISYDNYKSSPEINLCFYTTDNLETIFNGTVAEEIVDKFMEIVKDLKMVQFYKDGIFVFTKDDYFIVINPLKHTYISKCVSTASIYYNEALLDHSLFWFLFSYFGRVVAFTTTVEQRRELEYSRTFRKLKAKFFKVLKYVDTPNLIDFDEIKFSIDSKENLDEHYKGNLYLYSL